MTEICARCATFAESTFRCCATFARSPRKWSKRNLRWQRTSFSSTSTISRPTITYTFISWHSRLRIHQVDAALHCVVLCCVEFFFCSSRFESIINSSCWWCSAACTLWTHRDMIVSVMLKLMPISSTCCSQVAAVKEAICSIPWSQTLNSARTITPKPRCAIRCDVTTPCTQCSFLRKTRTQLRRSRSCRTSSKISFVGTDLEHQDRKEIKMRRCIKRLRKTDQQFQVSDRGFGTHLSSRFSPEHLTIRACSCKRLQQITGSIICNEEYTKREIIQRVRCEKFLYSGIGILLMFQIDDEPGFAIHDC